MSKAVRVASSCLVVPWSAAKETLEVAWRGVWGPLGSTEITEITALQRITLGLALCEEPDRI